jgi:hypothetical protein
VSGSTRFLNIESSGADKYIFVGAFAIGVLWILTTRLLFNAPAMVAVIAPVAIMFLYARIMDGGSFQLREDRAADNLYYLGFLFTLVSLGVGLYRYDSELGGVDNIIKDLGVGLTTTIFGLFLRIWFLQLRVDVDNASEDAKMELSHAIEEFRSHVLAMGDVSSQARAVVQQQYSESAEEIKKAVDGIKDSLKGLSRSVSSFDKRIDEIELPKDIFTSIFSSAEKEIQGSVTNLSTRINASDIGLEAFTKRFGLAGEKLSGELDRFGDRISVANIDTNALVAPLQEGISVAVEEFTSLSSILKPLANSIQASNRVYSEGVKQFEQSIDKWSMIVGEESPMSLASSRLNQSIESYSLVFKSIDQIPGKLEAVLAETQSNQSNIDSINQSLRDSMLSLNESIARAGSSTEQLNLEITKITKQFERTIETLLKAAS